jgi:hypothetical protein
MSLFSQFDLCFIEGCPTEPIKDFPLNKSLSPFFQKTAGGPVVVVCASM